ncbi:MAG: Ig-like domain-containing protein [Syntrophomonas sp.]
MDFGGRLKQIRESQMLSTSKLSKLSGLSQSFIWRIESGEKQPTLGTLSKLSQGLKMSIGELLGEELSGEFKSSRVNRIVNQIQKLPTEQVDALGTIISSLTNGHADGERPLALQSVKLNHPEQDGLDIELVFSANVSNVSDQKIPDGTKRNMACFHLFDDGMKEVAIDVLPGAKRFYGQKAVRTFIIRPLFQLTDGRVYKIYISKLLQANNYSYLKENHTVMFSTREIMNITPFNQELSYSCLSLTLSSSNIESGDENIPVNTDIVLTFSNNVIADAVRSHNLECFSLESSKKQPVEIDVIMAEPDDNSESQYEIIIHPRHDLLSNTVYVLIISENLQGGNQKRLKADQIITFRTGAANTADTNEQDGFSIA